VEDTTEKTTRYLNGLRYDIQDEMSLISPKNVDEAYQLALKAEDKIQRRRSSKGEFGTRGRGQPSGKGKVTNQKDGTSISIQQRQIEDETRGGRTASRGRGRGRGRETNYRINATNLVTDHLNAQTMKMQDTEEPTLLKQ